MPRPGEKSDQFWEDHAREHEREAGWLGNFLGIGAAANKPCDTCEREAYGSKPFKLEWW